MARVARIDCSRTTSATIATLRTRPSHRQSLSSTCSRQSSTSKTTTTKKLAPMKQQQQQHLPRTDRLVSVVRVAAATRSMITDRIGTVVTTGIEADGAAVVVAVQEGEDAAVEADATLARNDIQHNSARRRTPTNPSRSTTRTTSPSVSATPPTSRVSSRYQQPLRQRQHQQRRLLQRLAISSAIRRRVANRIKRPISGTNDAISRSPRADRNIQTTPSTTRSHNTNKELISNNHNSHSKTDLAPVNQFHRRTRSDRPLVNMLTTIQAVVEAALPTTTPTVLACNRPLKAASHNNARITGHRHNHSSSSSIHL